MLLLGRGLVSCAVVEIFPVCGGPRGGDRGEPRQGRCGRCGRDVSVLHGAANSVGHRQLQAIRSI